MHETETSRKLSYPCNTITPTREPTNALRSETEKEEEKERERNIHLCIDRNREERVKNKAMYFYRHIYIYTYPGENNISHCKRTKVCDSLVRCEYV